MRRFWVSWNQPTDDFRPLHDPPVEAVRGWWCSGEAGDGSYFTLCAVVDANDELGAKALVRQDWPEAEIWRFVDEKPVDWQPGDRFPMRPR